MTLSSALGGVDILEDNKWASAGITGFVNAGVDTSGDWNDPGWNDSKDAVAAGIAAGAASYASGRLASQQESSTDGQGRNILGLGKSDFGGDFSKGGYANKLIYNTINSGLLSMYNMAEHDLSWDDASRQSGFYSGMVYDHRDISGFVGSKVGAKLQSNYQDYRDHRAKEQQQERAGLPTDAEDPFNGAEEMLFGLMDGLRRTEESFSNLFSGDGFNTDADLNNMDWETYDGYMKTVENMTAKFQADPEGNFLNETTREEFIEYLQAKMRSGQELNDWEQQCVVDASSQYAVGTIVANFNGDYEHETDGQMAQLDDAGYDTANLKKHVGYMRKVDQYNKMVKAYQQAESQAYNSYKIYGSVDSRDMALLPAVSKINQARVEASNSSPGLWSGQNTASFGNYDVFTNDHYTTNYTDSPIKSLGKDVGYGLWGGLKGWANVFYNLVGTPIGAVDEGLTAIGLDQQTRDVMEAHAIANGINGDEFIVGGMKAVGMLAHLPLFLKNRKALKAVTTIAKSDVDDAFRHLDKADEVLDFTTKSVPYKMMGSKRLKELRQKIKNRTITKSEYERYKWQSRITKRRNEGVENFWLQEKDRILSGQPTRNWSADEIDDIINDIRPKFNGKTITGHHSYSVSKYPHLADKGEIIYPATFNEHIYRWHGGSYKNSLPGKPLNPLYPEEF